MPDTPIKVKFELGGQTCKTDPFKGGLLARSWAREHVQGEYSLVRADNPE